MYARILKFNPFHDHLGRFSNHESSIFVSTGAKFQGTISRLKAQMGKAEKNFSPAKPYAQDLDSITESSSSLYNKTVKQWDKLSKGAQSAVRDYTSSGYESINTHVNDPSLLGGNHSVNGLVKDLDDATEDMEAPAAMVTYRSAELPKILTAQGIRHGLDVMGRKAIDSRLDSLVGTTFRDPSFGSSSISAQVASSFLYPDRVMLEIQVPKGAKGVWVGSGLDRAGSNVRTAVPSEHEFLFPRDRIYRVTGVSKVKVPFSYDRTVLQVEMLNPTESPKPLSA